MSWSIERYLNVRQAYGPSFAPDGEALAFLTNITGVPQVWQVPLIEGAQMLPWPEQLTFETDRISDAAYAPVTGQRRLLYVYDVGGTERHQLFLLDVDDAVVHRLTEGHEQMMHLFGAWSDDGERICFGANRRDPALFDLYVQDIDADAHAEARLVWENDARGYLRNLAFSPDGQRIIVTRVRSSFDHALLEINIAQGTMRKLLERGEPVRFADVCYSPEGDALYLITDLDSDFLHVARMSLETEEIDRLVTPAWNCGGLALSNDGTKLAYTVNVEGADHVACLDLQTWETRSVPEFAEAPGIVTDGQLRFSPDGGKLAFAFSSAIRTSDVYVWDLTQDEVRAVTASSHGGLLVSVFVAPELIRYPTFDTDDEGKTREIPAWLYRPVDPDGPVPAVVMVHGGPEGQFQPYFHFLIQYLLHHGYAVLAPNVRGSTGYGKTYSHLDDVEKRMDSVADLAHAARCLQQEPGIDGDKLVVYGGSYGGFMVLSAMTTYPELWAAGVDIVGISNLATFLENTSDYRRAHREAEYGSLERDRAFLEEIAPINHVDQIAVPLMVIHGRNDPRVPFSEAEQLVAALEARNVPVRFLVFEDEGHGVVKLKNKLVAYPAIVAFLDEHLR